jgi:hypothetical protein
MIETLAEPDVFVLDPVDALGAIAVIASPAAIPPFVALAGAALDEACCLDDAARLLLEAGAYTGQHGDGEVAAMLWDLADAISGEVDR